MSDRPCKLDEFCVFISGIAIGALLAMIIGGCLR